MEEDLKLAKSISHSGRSNVFAIRYEDAVGGIIEAAEQLYRYLHSMATDFLYQYFILIFNSSLIV